VHRGGPGRSVGNHVSGNSPRALPTLAPPLRDRPWSPREVGALRRLADSADRVFATRCATRNVGVPPASPRRHPGVTLAIREFEPSRATLRPPAPFFAIPRLDFCRGAGPSPSPARAIASPQCLHCPSRVRGGHAPLASRSSSPRDPTRPWRPSLPPSSASPEGRRSRGGAARRGDAGAATHGDVGSSCDAAPSLAAPSSCLAEYTDGPPHAETVYQWVGAVLAAAAAVILATGATVRPPIQVFVRSMNAPGQQCTTPQSTPSALAQTKPDETGKAARAKCAPRHCPVRPYTLDISLRAILHKAQNIPDERCSWLGCCWACQAVPFGPSQGLCEKRAA
jgi:hypothetical protein